MPDLAPGQPPPPLFFPPFPNEEKMRRGHMNDEAPLGILGETHSVKREFQMYCFHSIPLMVLPHPLGLALLPFFRLLPHVSFVVAGTAELMRYSHHSAARIAHSGTAGPSWREPLSTRLPAAPATAVLRPRPGSQPGSLGVIVFATVLVLVLVLAAWHPASLGFLPQTIKLSIVRPHLSCTSSA